MEKQGWLKDYDDGFLMVETKISVEFIWLLLFNRIVRIIMLYSDII